MTETKRGYLAVALAAGAVYALGMGIRQAQPLFISAINSHTGVGYASISLAFAVAQLMWGVAQPAAGAVADRWGHRAVMIGGTLLAAAATAAIPFAQSSLALILLIGLLGGAGAGTFGQGMLMSVANRWIPAAKHGIASGIINAGGSFGQFTLIPFAQLLIGVAGWQPALMILGATGLLAVPLVLYLTQGSAAAAAAAKASTAGGTLRQALRDAANDRSYLLLNIGFFTCGFHVAFIATHLPGVVASCALPATVGAWSLSIIGLFNIIGSLWIGNRIQHWRMKIALAGIYSGRGAHSGVLYSPRPKSRSSCSPPASVSPTFRRCRPRWAWWPSCTARATWRPCSAW